MKKYTDKDRLFFESHTVEQIADHYHISTYSVYSTIKYHNWNYIPALVYDIEYLKNHTIKESAEHYKKNYFAVYRYCKSHKIKTKDEVNKYTEKERLFFESHSIREIAEKYHISKNEVYGIAKYYNWNIKRVYNKYDTEYLKTHTIEEVMKYYGISRDNYYYICRARGLIPKTDTYRLCDNINDFELTKQDIEYVKNHTMESCCIYFDCSEYLIKKIYKKYGIKRLTIKQIEKNRMIEFLRDHTINQTAEVFGKTYSMVYQFSIRHKEEICH